MKPSIRWSLTFIILLLGMGYTAASPITTAKGMNDSLVLTHTPTAVAPSSATHGNTTSPSPQDAPERTYSPTLQLSGLVNSPRSYNLTDLQALPSKEVTATFISASGTQTHLYKGVLLHDLLPSAGPKFDPAVKNDSIRWYAKVGATDGYMAVGASLIQSWKANEADGVLLGDDDGMARLVVPGDQHGARYVSNINEITLLRTE